MQIIAIMTAKSLIILRTYKINMTAKSLFLLYFSMNFGEIETDNFTVSNSEIITFDFTVSKNSIFMK